MLFKKKSRLRIFDQEYYTASYPDVKESGQDPYRHFLRVGLAEKRNPCAVFDTEYYLSQVGAISGDPTEHYQTRGVMSGAEPHPTFDREWYLENNSDVVADGVDPFWHYFRYGRAEGRRPGPAWRMQFAGAKRPLWRLAAETSARRLLRLRFGHGELAQPAEFHAVYGFNVYMTPAQVLRFSKERDGYQDYLRAESRLKPNIVILLSSVNISPASGGGIEAKYDSGRVFALRSCAYYQACDLGGGNMLVDFYD